MKLAGTASLPPGFDLTSATIARNRLLYEPAAADGAALEPVRLASGRPLGAIDLTGDGNPGTLASAAVAGQPRLLAAARPDRVRAQLKLGPAHHGVRSYSLTVDGADVVLPNACDGLRASSSLHTPPFELTSTVVLHGRHRTISLPMPAVWHCLRGRNGAIVGFEPAENRPRAGRPGLALSASGPRTVIAGTTARFSVAVHNRRGAGGGRFVSSLFGLRMQGGAGLLVRAAAGGYPRVRVTTSFKRELHELRHGHSATIGITARVPDSPGRLLCAGGLATAVGARQASGQVCARILAPPAPRFTG